MDQNKDQTVNGNMANSMEELKILGKEMEQMHEENLPKNSSDPIQYDNKLGWNRIVIQ